MIENGVASGWGGWANRMLGGSTPAPPAAARAADAETSSGAARSGGAGSGPAFQFGGSLAALFDGSGQANAVAAADRLKETMAAAEAFGNQVEQALATAEERVGQLLSMLGMDDEEVTKAKQQLGEKTGRRPAAGDGTEDPTQPQISPFAPPTLGEGSGRPGLSVPGATEAAAVAQQSQQSRFALQVESIELTLETGGKKLSVSFEQTTAMVEASSSSLLAARASGPGGEVAMQSRSHEELLMASQERSLEVSFEGGTAEETAAMRAQLESLIAEGGLDALMNGGGGSAQSQPPSGGPPAAVRIRPAPGGDGTTAADGQSGDGLEGVRKFMMDLAVPILGPPRASPATASGGTGAAIRGGVDLVA